MTPVRNMYENALIMVTKMIHFCLTNLSLICFIRFTFAGPGQKLFCIRYCSDLIKRDPTLVSNTSNIKHFQSQYCFFSATTAGVLHCNKSNSKASLYRVHQGFRSSLGKILFLGHFWPLPKQVVFFKAAGAVLKIGSVEADNFQWEYFVVRKRG